MACCGLAHQLHLPFPTLAMSSPKAGAVLESLCVLTVLGMDGPGAWLRLRAPQQLGCRGHLYAQGADPPLSQDREFQPYWLLQTIRLSSAFALGTLGHCVREEAVVAPTLGSTGPAESGLHEYGKARRCSHLSISVWSSCAYPPLTRISQKRKAPSFNRNRKREPENTARGAE